MRRPSSNQLRHWRWLGCELRHSQSMRAHSRSLRTTSVAPNAHPSAASSCSTSRPSELRITHVPSPTPTHRSSQPSLSHSQPNFVDGQLTRDFISASLYSAASGYFNTSNRIYTAPSPSSLPFATLGSRDAYYHRLGALYSEFDDCWLTPVELFKPHYAHSIARWIQQQEQQQQSDNEHGTDTLRIVEVGGGNGTCAAGILDYLREKQPQLYGKTHYTIVDLSTTNRERQLATLASHLTTTASAAPSANAMPRVDVLTMSMLDWSEVIEQRVYVIGLEVLDNMPHDKLVQHNSQLYETHVHSLASPTAMAASASDLPLPPTSDPNQRYREWYQPVTDPFIREYVEYQSQYAADPPQPTSHSYGTLGNQLAMWVQGAIERVTGLLRRREESVVWLPTTALHFFHVLHHFMPQHRLLLADFSSLPDTIAGMNGPIVSGRETTGSDTNGAAKRGRTKDYQTYLIDLGLADIFFPTDFAVLQYVYGRVRSLRAQRDSRTLAVHSPRVLTNYEFMAKYAVEAAQREWIAEGKAGRWRSPTQTRATFDPLLHDYINVKFLVS